MVNCYSMRKLSLSSVCLVDDMLQTLLNSCPFIVSFKCYSCFGLENIELLNLPKIKSVLIWKSSNQIVKIRAPTLEHLNYFTDPEESPELNVVDAPNLVSLVYQGFEIPSTFMGANLRWSFHPRRIVLNSTCQTIASFMDVLIHMKSSSDSTSHGSDKPLHRLLKQVQAYKFDGQNWRWLPVELTSARMAIRNLIQRNRFCFLLDW